MNEIQSGKIFLFGNCTNDQLDSNQVSHLDITYTEYETSKQGRTISFRIDNVRNKIERVFFDIISTKPEINLIE